MKNTARTETWASWVVGLGVGVGAGFAALLGGPLLAILGLAFIAFGFAARGSLAFLSGGYVGLGALWLGLTIRSQVECQTIRDPAVTCATQGPRPPLMVSAAIAAGGVVAGVAAWRRQATRSRSDAGT